VNKAALIVQMRSMVAENPIEVTFTENSVSQTNDCGVANVDVSALQLTTGEQASYRRSIWTFPDDWTTVSVPAKRDCVTIGSTIYRVLKHKDYYMDTVRRLDLGDQYESGGR